MPIISAKILDSTHLELSQPIEGLLGTMIQIVVPESPEDLSRIAIRDHSNFLSAYAPEDEGLYDDLV